MKAKPNTTIAELMKEFPNGFSVGSGTPDILCNKEVMEISINLGETNDNDKLLFKELIENNEYKIY